MRSHVEKSALTASARALSLVAIFGSGCAPQVPPPAVSGATSSGEASRRSAADEPAGADPGATALGKARSLPRLEVETIGLHIGGGPNDRAAKEPFLRSIEQEFDSFRRCYRLVATPESGGVFGIDLYISREGGNGTVRDVRTGMRPDSFRRCLRDAFERVVFERPPRGPAVISYSLRFALVGLSD